MIIQCLSKKKSKGLLESIKARKIDSQACLLNEYHIPSLDNKRNNCAHKANFPIKEDNKLIQKFRRNKLLNIQHTILSKLPGELPSQHKSNTNVLADGKTVPKVKDKSILRNNLLDRIDLKRIRHGKRLLHIRKKRPQKDTNEILINNTRGKLCKELYKTFYEKNNEDECRRSRNSASKNFSTKNGLRLNNSLNTNDKESDDYTMSDDCNTVIEYDCDNDYSLLVESLNGMVPQE